MLTWLHRGVLQWEIAALESFATGMKSSFAMFRFLIVPLLVLFAFLFVWLGSTIAIETFFGWRGGNTVLVCGVVFGLVFAPLAFRVFKWWRESSALLESEWFAPVKSDHGRAHASDLAQARRAQLEQL